MGEGSVNVESEVVNEHIEKFHEPKYLESKYHETEITVVEFDHRGSTLNGESFSLPPDWKQKLFKVLDENQNATIAPEYCMPDLEQYAFKELGTGELARQSSEDSQGISEFYGLISRYAGSKGKNQLAIDPANTNWYLFSEATENARRLIPEQMKAKLEKREPEYQDIYAGKYGEISKKELNTLRLIDARRLITARGLMQEALRSKQKILHINAPKHAERVHNYIERQVDWEANSTIKVEKPVDQKYVEPKEEERKMILYGRRPFQRTVREYTPQLPSKYYQLEIDLKDPPELARPAVGVESRQDNLTESMLKIGSFIEKNSNTNDKTEQKQLERLKQAQGLIEKLLAEGGKGDFRRLSRLVSTDWAWKLVRKDYVY